MLVFTDSISNFVTVFKRKSNKYVALVLYKSK